MIAHKSAATRKKNKQSVAEGKPATHSLVGKARQKAAAKEPSAQEREGVGAGPGGDEPHAGDSAPVSPAPANGGAPGTNGPTHS